MSCNWVGYCVVMPKKPDFVKAREAMAHVREQVMALLPRLEGEDEDQAADAVTELEALLVEPDMEPLHWSGAGRELLKRAQEALDFASEKWPPSYPDGDWRPVGNSLVLFAGDMTWGDTPDGDGYRLLRGLDTFLAVAAALELE